MKKENFLHKLKLLHTPEAIQKRLLKGPRHSYLKDFIYGAIDGTVTTFAVIAGVAGAGLSNSVIIILGLCNLLADGFSMAASNYLGTRAELEQGTLSEKEERREIAVFPEGEREEIRQIFASKGFKGDELEKVVSVITSDNEVWLDTMMREELGVAKQITSPLKAAWATFFAFVTIGFFPLIPFITNYFFPYISMNLFTISIAITAFAFFVVGASKSCFTHKNWILSGLETLLVGGSAALLAFLVGTALKRV